MTTTDHRNAAQERTRQLTTLLEAQPNNPTITSLLLECHALTVAIAAFHMEGIRFRMFNVDRLLSRSGAAVPADAAPIFAQVRHELEAAGFHTRSHQAPT